MARKTENYRQHHSDVRALVARIESLLHLPQIAADAGPVALVVRELFGKFGIHLTIEDANLYPRMLNHPDPKVRDAANRFQSEMGGLKTRFDDYRHKWPGPLAIAKQPAAFVEETRQVLDALKQRIAREDTQLYDLYDQVA